MAKKPPSNATLKKETDWQAKFLEVLADTANVRQACIAVGIRRDQAYAIRADDAEFRKRWQDAVDDAVDQLELEARRRAYAGNDEPVWYRGEQCGTVRKYSDTLIIFLLKAHRPAVYRESVEAVADTGTHDGIKLVKIVKPSNG